MTRRSSPPPEWIFAIGFVCGLLTLALVHAVLPSSFDRDIELVRAVRDLAAETYVEEPDSREMLDDALRGMVAGLDRYSRYYGPAELAEIERETSGEYKGIGVVFRDPVAAGQIRFTLPGGPADLAGLTVGDRFVEIDGDPVEEMGEEAMRALLQGDEELAVLVEGRDGGRRSVHLLPQAVIDPTVRHARMLDRDLGIGYLAIVAFTHRTPEEFDRWMQYLEGEGMRALVLDLRSNPGGILDAADAASPTASSARAPSSSTKTPSRDGGDQRPPAGRRGALRRACR